MTDVPTPTPRLTGKILMGALSCLRRAAHESVVEEDAKPRLAEVITKEAIVLGLLADPDRREALVRDVILTTEAVRFTKRPKLKAFSTKQDMAVFAVDTLKKLEAMNVFKHAKPIPQKLLSFNDAKVWLPMDLYVPNDSAMYSFEVGSSASRLRGVALAMSLLKVSEQELRYGGIFVLGKEIEHVTFDMEAVWRLASRAYRLISAATKHIDGGGAWGEIECRPTERTCAQCPLLKAKTCPEAKALKIGEL